MKTEVESVPATDQKISLAYADSQSESSNPKKCQVSHKKCVNLLAMCASCSITYECRQILAAKRSDNGEQIYRVSRVILHQKTEIVDAVGWGMWIGDHSFEKLFHLSVELPVMKAFLIAIRADLSCTPLFYDASCFDIIVP